MSNQADMAFFREEITEAEKARKVSFGCAVIGVVLGLLSQYYFHDLYWEIMWLIFLFGSGIAYFHYDSKKKRLKLQLMRLEFMPKCSKCGKSLPEGKFLFCPFCSAPLTKKKATES